MHTPSLSLYVDCLERGDRQGVADLMLASAHKLASIGASFLISPDNTIHDAMDLVLPQSPLQWLHIAEVVTDEASRRGFQRVGILGTRWLIDSDVYPEKFAARGIGFMRPSDDERDEINRIIMEELTYGISTVGGIALHQQVIERMKREGCDAVALACTEIPLIMNDENSPLPTLDSTRLLALAALRRALDGEQ
jgi:aspartate racemase